MNDFKLTNLTVEQRCFISKVTADIVPEFSLQWIIILYDHHSIIDDLYVIISQCLFQAKQITVVINLIVNGFN